MFAIGMLRVGVFFLVLSTTLLAETIPFDYWYGRIMGGQHFSADYTDAKYGRSRYALSYGGGFRNRFQIGVPNAVIWTPYTTGDKSDWTNPTFDGALRLSNSTRYLLDRIDIRDDESRVSHPGYASQYKRESYEWNQSVIHLDEGEIEYSPEKAAYLYLDGIWLAPRQTYVKMEADLKIGRARSKFIGATYNGEKTTEWNESRQRSAEARLKLRTGLSQSLNFSLSTSLFHSAMPARRSGNRTVMEPDPVNPMFSDYLSHTNPHETVAMIAPSLNWIASARLWMEIGVNAEYDWSNSNIYDSQSERGGGSMAIQSFERTLSSLKLHFGSTWLSQRQSIECEQILDNYQGYYGNTLSKNTLRVFTAVNYSGAGEEFVSWIHNQGGPPYIVGPYSRRTISFDVAPDYSLGNSLTIGAKAQLEKRVENDWHSQSFVSSLHVDFLNYNWRREKRHDISWAHAGDIDYLLGATMRPGDLSCSAELEFPRGSASGPNPGAGFWTFYRFRFDDDWRFMVTSSLGVKTGAEVGMDIEFQNNDPFSQGPNRTRWFLTPRMRVQPLRWLRITSTAMNEYYHPNDIFYYGSVDDLRRTWKFDLKVDCVF